MEKEMICSHCGYIGKEERFSKGNFFFEMFLWLCLFVPGAIYTVWRSFNEYWACPVCQNRDMTPLNSKFGKKIFLEKKHSQTFMSRGDQIEVISKIMRF